MRILTKGIATEAAIKKATEMIKHRVIHAKPKAVKIGSETIRVFSNSEYPCAVIYTPYGTAYVWSEKESGNRLCFPPIREIL